MILTALCEKTAGGTLQMNCGTDLKQVPQSGTLFFWDSRSGQDAFKNDCMHGWNTTKYESLKRCHVFFVYFRTLLDKTTQEALQQSQKKNLLLQKKTHKLHSPSQIQESFRCSRKLLQSQTHWGNNGKKRCWGTSKKNRAIQTKCSEKKFELPLGLKPMDLWIDISSESIDHSFPPTFSRLDSWSSCQFGKCFQQQISGFWPSSDFVPPSRSENH